MLEKEKIEQIAKAVASANLASSSVSEVRSEPFVDSEGHDALRITVILTPGSADKISGDATLNTLVKIQSELQRAGENRFALVQYATAAELEESASS
jgi:hypothetical protein